MHEPIDISRRVKAARTLGGFNRAVDLARAIDERGFGEGPIRLIETGQRAATHSELYAIGRACGLPVEFFTCPQSHLGLTGASPNETAPSGCTRSRP